MRKFNVGDKIIDLESLQLSAGPHNFDEELEILTVKSADDRYFSPFEIDLASDVKPEFGFKKCNQADGNTHGIQKDHYLNLSSEPVKVLRIIDKVFKDATLRDRDLADQEIERLEALIKKSELEIESLRKASPNESRLESAKESVLKRLGLKKS